MSLASVCIKRPVLATVLNIFVLIIGFIGFTFLGVRDYPSVDPPIISVRTTFSGANADVIETQITEPLEASINGIPGIRSISSVSSDGTSYISVEFNIEVDLETAANDVRNKVSEAQRKLPADVDPPVVTKADADAEPIYSVTLESESRSIIDLSEYAEVNFKERLQTIPGVSSVDVRGSRRMSIRLKMDPMLLAAYGLTPMDVRDAVTRENIELPAGRIEGDNTELIIRTLGRLETIDDFNNLIISQDGERVVRFSDVGEAIIEAQNTRSILKRNGVTMVSCMLIPQPGANYITIVDNAVKGIEQIKKDLPEDIVIRTGFDNTKFIRQSINEVQHTIVEAFVLVVLIIFLFLRTWRTTLIPVLAIPVSLIGAFFIMYICGFSINILTLLAIVLAIGLVVDDAIVVMENMARILETEDLTPRQATAKAMHEVTGAVIAIVLVLCAVFIPVGFMGGLAGVMYRQFAITIAISVTLSGIVALTLTPTLCVMLIKKSHKQPNRFFRWFNTAFEHLTDRFTDGVRFFIRRSVITLLVVAAVCAATWDIFGRVPTALVPEEDQGSILVMGMMPDGTALPQTIEVMDSVAAKIQELPEVESLLSVAGFDLMNGALNTNSGVMFVTLKDWAEREKMGISVQDTIGRIYGIGMAETKGLILPFNPPPIMGLSNTGGFEAMIMSNEDNPKELSDIVRAVTAEAAKRPELSGVSSTYSVNSPRLYVDLDREKARMLNVNVADVFNTMAATLGASYINDFNMNGRTFRVYMQADAPYRSLPDEMGSIYVQSRDGNNIPLVSLVTIHNDSGPQLVTHFNGLLAAKVTGNPASGYSSGQALQAMQEVCAQVLPQGYSLAWSGSSYQEVVTGGTDFSVLGLALLMVFLILAAQYERWTLPLAVLTAVPFAVFGAIVGNWLTGQNNDVYTQVAFFTLLGLACKNAILIVEFAADLHRQGMSVIESAVQSAKLRFRPIIMTSLAFILGCVPLAVSTGAGASSRRAIGISVVFGMLAASTLAPLIVPFFYKIIMSAAEKAGGRKTPAARPADGEN